MCVSFLAAGLLAGFVLTYHIPGNKPRLKSELRVGNEAGLSRLSRKKRGTGDTQIGKFEKYRNLSIDSKPYD